LSEFATICERKHKAQSASDNFLPHSIYDDKFVTMMATILDAIIVVKIQRKLTGVGVVLDGFTIGVNSFVVTPRTLSSSFINKEDKKKRLY